MKNSILVSVSIVTYNHKDYIKKCLDGVLMQQTNFSYEIILGEDESDDGTREICIAYAKKYPEKIKLYLRNRKDVIYINGNPTGRFNMIENLKACNGKYVALCEGDDYWIDPLKLQKQVDYLEANKDYSICFHNVKLYFQDSETLKDDYIARHVDETTTINDLANGNFIHTPSVMFVNNFKLPKQFKKSPIGDWSLYMTLIEDKKIKKIDKVMAVYRLHKKSIWSNKDEKQKVLNSIKSFRIILRTVKMKKTTKDILKRKINFYESKLPNNTSLTAIIKKKIKKVINR